MASQIKQFADRHKLPAQNAASTTTASSTSAKVSFTAIHCSYSTTTTVPTQATASATGTPTTPYKSSVETTPADPMLTSAKTAEFWPAISQTLSTTNPGPTTWPQPRPTLSGGISSGRMSGTPSQIARSDDGSALASDDTRSRNKNTPGHQSMRRTIQDLVASVDPNVKIEPEVEDVSICCACRLSSAECDMVPAFAIHR